MTSTRTLALALATLGLVGIYGCSKQEEAKPAPKAEAPKPAEKPVLNVKIGHVAPLTGGQAHLGKDNENGARLAVEDINAKKIEIDGKVLKLELMGEDDAADPKQGTTVAQKLVDAKVAGVVGHLNSGTTIPASKLYHQAGITQISPSATNPEYTRQGFKTAFRVMADDIAQGTAIGDYIADGIKAKTVAIIDDRTAYGKGLADETEKVLKAKNVKVVTREFTDDKAKDFKAILTKIKSKNPDVVMYGGMDAQGGPMVKQMKELGLKSKYISGDGVCSTDWAAKLSEGSAEGHFCTQAGLPPEQMPRGADFKKRFEAKYGPIQVYAPYSYDAVYALSEAMKKANSTDPGKYLSELSKVSFEGVTAKIEFDEKGDTKYGAITVFQVKDGKLVPLSSVGPGAPKAAPAATETPEPAKK